MERIKGKKGQIKIAPIRSIMTSWQFITCPASLEKCWVRNKTLFSLSCCRRLAEHLLVD